MAATSGRLFHFAMTKPKEFHGGRLLTLNQAAEYLAVSHWTLRKLIWAGAISHVRIGRLVQLDRADLDAFIEAKK
jgi:excisionase family DNA binding protein